MTKADASEAIVSLLRRIDAKPNQMISLYKIGIPLIVGAAAKYTETEGLNGLLWLSSEKLIEINDNCLTLVKHFLMRRRRLNAFQISCAIHLGISR